MKICQLYVKFPVNSSEQNHILYETEPNLNSVEKINAEFVAKSSRKDILHLVQQKRELDETAVL